MLIHAQTTSILAMRVHLVGRSHRQWPLGWVQASPRTNGLASPPLANYRIRPFTKHLIYRPHELNRSTYEVGSEEVDWGSVTPGEVHRLHQARFSGYTRRGSAATPSEVRRLHQERFTGFTRRGSSIRPPPAPPVAGGFQ